MRPVAAARAAAVLLMIGDEPARRYAAQCSPGGATADLYGADCCRARVDVTPAPL